MKRKKGISLIILIITIIVIIILASSVIISLIDNNSILKASHAKFLSDIKNFENELNLYQSKQILDEYVSYNPNLLQADEISITYDGEVDSDKNINDIITLLSKDNSYSGKFIILNGKLAFQGSDINLQNFVKEIGIQVIDASEPLVYITSPSSTSVDKGTDVVYTINFSSNSSLTTIDLTDKVELVDNLGIPLLIQPNIIISEVSGTSLDFKRQVDISIKTDNIETGLYKLKIKSGSATNSNNMTVSQDILSSIGFNVTNVTTAPYNMTSYRGNIGTVYTFIVTGNATGGTVWGTDIYTDDSSIAAAAVHAGKLTNGVTGTVYIEMLSGYSSYTGTTRYSVTTLNYGSWSGSYKFN